jgi:hypothetical protein
MQQTYSQTYKFKTSGFSVLEKQQKENNGLIQTRKYSGYLDTKQK